MFVFLKAVIYFCKQIEMLILKDEIKRNCKPMKGTTFVKGKEIKEKAAQRGLAGLYDPANEHDACGVGMIVNIHGNKSQNARVKAMNLSLIHISEPTRP